MALASIADLIEGEEREAFLADKAKPHALAMFFVVLGEAANKVSPAVKSAYPELAWSYAAKLRHLIAHEYQRVDHQQLWEFATLDAPEMLAYLPQPPEPEAFD
ncbi:HepT-like ribonuclease domain-containing protein [Brevundimonas bacteroides]|uniref:HepT-like ribonuclease domain-containing protein n=1 Tax=Brevundimonas bacteroides TaxID=74311 RepID=UPI00138E16F0|nr:HepT-like ribonuclease domain-containing protein [Brevundimonas bacteroides]